MCNAQVCSTIAISDISEGRGSLYIIYKYSVHMLNLQTVVYWKEKMEAVALKTLTRLGHQNKGWSSLHSDITSCLLPIQLATSPGQLTIASTL